MLDGLGSLCNGCSACMAICPYNAISMEKNEEGFLYPRIDSTACRQCRLCEKTCSVIHCNIENKYAVRAYAAMNTDESARRHSSSGGIFRLLAENVIANGGVVFGVKLDENMNAIHSYTENIDELFAFQGAKYVQSEIGDAFRQVERFLNEKRQVLFSGTPCQVAGLRSFLGEENDLLLCVDIICHGVPSPKVWRKYLEFHEKAEGSTVSKVLFRDKRVSWQRYSLTLNFENSTQKSSTFRNDLMMRAFLKNVCLRESCYSCSFKSVQRCSDITLADLWGVERLAPSMNDNQGTSLVVIQTARGDKAFKILKQIKYVDVSVGEALKYNPAMIHSVPYNPKREAFLGAIDTLAFDAAVHKYCKDSLAVKAKVVVYTVGSKVKRFLFRALRING